MTRNVFVTGGAGFIGSAVCRHLVGAGVNVLNVDAITYAGNLKSLSRIDNAPNYQFAKIDVCDRRAIAEALTSFAPDHVIHLAAESHVDRSSVRRDDTLRPEFPLFGVEGRVGSPGFGLGPHLRLPGGHFELL
jgi:dTDP-glucose 4,6-dehydratase